MTHLAGNVFLIGDLYEITVRGTTYYLTGREVDISWDNGTGSHTYSAAGAMLTRERIRQGSDGTIDDLVVNVLHGGTLTLGGVTWQARWVNGDFRGAPFKVRRAYFSASTTVVDAPLWFDGTVGSVEPASTEMRLTVRSLASQLAGEVPVNEIQAQCTWNLYDSGCGVTRPTTWDAAATAAGSTATNVKMASITQAAAFFRYGMVEFLSGALVGLSRTIVDSAQNGAHQDLTVAPPLPSAPATGVTIRVRRGCDKTVATCNGTFSNLVRMMAFPMAPRADVLR